MKQKVQEKQREVDRNALIIDFNFIAFLIVQEK